MKLFDVAIVLAFVTIDDLRNGLIGFLASQDLLTLIALLFGVMFFGKKLDFSGSLERLTGMGGSKAVNETADGHGGGH